MFITSIILISFFFAGIRPTSPEICNNTQNFRKRKQNYSTASEINDLSIHNQFLARKCSDNQLSSTIEDENPLLKKKHISYQRKRYISLSDGIKTNNLDLKNLNIQFSNVGNNSLEKISSNASDFILNSHFDEKSEMDSLLKIVDELTNEFTSFEQTESQKKIDNSNCTTQLESNSEQDFNLVTDSQLEEITVHKALKNTETKNPNTSIHRQFSNIQNKSHQYSSKQQNLNYKEILKRNMELIQTMRVLFDIKFFLGITSDNIDNLEKDSIFNTAESIIEKEIQNSIFDLINEYRIKCTVHYRIINAQYFRHQQFCSNCLYGYEFNTENFKNDNTDLISLCNNIKDPEMKKKIWDFFDFQEKCCHTPILLTLVFKAANYFKSKKVILHKFLENFDINIDLKLDLSTKTNLLLHQFHTFTCKNLDKKIILLPEIHSVSHCLHQISLINLAKDKNIFFILFFLFFSMNKFFETLCSTNMFDQLKLSVINKQTEFIMQFISFILRLYFIDPILGLISLQKHIRIQYQLFFFKRLQLILKSLQKRDIESNQINFLDHCLRICLECKEFLTSELFLTIYFNYDVNTFLEINKKRINQFENFLKTHRE